MQRATIVIAERSGKRDLFFFMMGAWLVSMLQILKDLL